MLNKIKVREGTLNKITLIRKNVTKVVTNLLFPQFCIKCGRFGELLCEDCIKKHKLNTVQRCPHCENRSVEGFPHTKCSKQTPIDKLIVIAKFEEIEQQLVHKLKYKNNKESAEVIAKLIKRKIYNKIDFNEFILCPIPLHKARLRSRGYNQAERIAAKLSEKLPDIVIQNLLVRTRNTKQQNKLNREERIANLNNAFEIAVSTELPQKVLLLDDVTTSGSTFKEAALILKRNGVKIIWCLAFARGK